MKLIQQIVLTVTWTELKSCNAASLAMLTAGIAVCPSREFVPPAEKERAVTKRDVLAGEYAEFYPKFVSQLVDLLSRVEAIDQECARIDGSAPSGEYRRLRGVEQRAVLRISAPPTHQSPKNCNFLIGRPATARLGRRRARRWRRSSRCR